MKRTGSSGGSVLLEKICDVISSESMTHVSVGGQLKNKPFVSAVVSTEKY